MTLRPWLVAFVLTGMAGSAIADDTETTTAVTTTEVDVDHDDDIDEGVDEAAASTPGPRRTELGIFGGVFASNFHHQFYDEDNVALREELDEAAPLFGIRASFFLTKYFGLEAEASAIITSTKDSDESVSIYGLHGSAIIQYPGRITPFVSLGAGAWISTSPLLGDDVDVPLHAGGGVRFYLSHHVVLRVDGRFLRGPSNKDPWTLDASYGEFSLGLSFVPHSRRTKHAPIVVENPDPDNDGVLAAADQCPTEAEDKDTFQDEDGCPDPDNDMDGVADLSDRCPAEPEDKDGYQDDDGCPDADNDADGVIDTADKCPLEAEDADGFEDVDGCPDPDNDQDGIVDATDKCPAQPETKNNYIDGDGCPDEVPAEVKKFTGVIQGINFRTNSAALLKTSNRQLDKAVAVLKQFPDMSIEIQGHTDDRPIKKSKTNKFETNLELSQARAESVAAYFESKGIAKERLTAKGYGDTAPVVAPTGLKGSKLTQARAKNRRVEFQLVNR